jgi:hypothetical protein
MARREILGNLDFRWAELSADFVALCSGQDVPTLHHHNLTHFDSLLREEATPFNGARTLLDLWGEVTQVESASCHGFSSARL